MKKLILLLFPLLVFIPLKTSAQSEIPLMVSQCELNGIDYQRSVAFVVKFQEAIQSNDKVKVASFVEYPLRVNTSISHGTKYKVTSKYIANTKQLIKNYDAVFTKALRVKILQQNSKDIFCNYQGAMIADGGVWFMEKNKEMRIIAVNI